MLNHDWQCVSSYDQRWHCASRHQTWTCARCGKALRRTYVSHRRGWQVAKGWDGECKGTTDNRQPLLPIAGQTEEKT